ncbi:MAG: glycosyltransferase [Pseudomonadota bacterium]
MSWGEFFHISFIVSFGYFLAVNAYQIVVLLASYLEHRFRVKQEGCENFDIVRASEFTIPVSVLIPAYNEENLITDTVLSVLKNGYPNFEIIVVNDGSKDSTLERLKTDFKLERVTLFYRHSIPTELIRGIFRSREYPNLIVIDKVNGETHADATNAGVNLARYRYILTLDADTILEKGAILKAVRLALRNPREVVGVGSLIGISNGFDIRKGEIRRHRVNGGILVNLQVLEYLRAFLINRLGWSRGNFNMCVSGAFSLWRRDLIVEMGGFRRDFSCDDMEMTYRVHHHFRNKKIAYQILSLPDPVAWTEAPSKTYSLYLQRHRWQRVTNEAAYHYRNMLLNPRFGTVGWLGMPYMWFAEVIGPWIELFSYLLIPLGWAFGELSFEQLGLFLMCSAGLSWTFSLVSLMMFDSAYPVFRLGDIFRLSIVGAAEFLGFRQILSISRFMGTLASFSGYKGWDKFDREKRVASAA